MGFVLPLTDSMSSEKKNTIFLHLSFIICTKPIIILVVAFSRVE